MCFAEDREDVLSTPYQARVGYVYLMAPSVLICGESLNMTKQECPKMDKRELSHTKKSRKKPRHLNWFLSYKIQAASGS